MPVKGRKALIRREQVGTGMFCRSQYEEGLTMPKEQQRFTSQRMPAQPMTEPQGQLPVPKQVPSRGEKQEEYSKLNGGGGGEQTQGS